ncbi:branched-chain amino acid ABC transporter permease [Bacillus massilinigeriensis]|uniref:branched-chain amino acid ABC transporter permease n=1 Tax=Bacillus massilionigeriensis TaxID=1805475 RepID=UPI00096AE094|nr:branched-chain amino acid ABC transporter permease [Bacillus massilionigeriensis]
MLADLINPYYLQVGSFVLINIILGVSIYITLSTGQLSLAGAGFMGIGAYTSALLTIHFDLPIYVGILAGALLSGIIGIIVGIPTLRLQGVYLAIVTLGLGEVIRVLFINWEPLTKGSVGLSGIPHLGREILKLVKEMGFNPTDFGLQNNQFIFLTIFVLLLLITIIVIWFFRRQNRSRVGRAFSAIKLDEQAAEAMGINITYFKVLAFAQGALLAGFAGALFAHMLGYISPADFSYHRAVDILIFAVFGGSEVIWGPVLGAFFLTLMPEVLRFISEYRYMIYGAMIIILMAVRPQGLIDVYLLHWLKRKTTKRGQKHGTSNQKSM